MTQVDAVALRVALTGVSQVQAGLRTVGHSLQNLQAQGNTTSATLQRAGTSIQRLAPALGSVGSAAGTATAGMGALSSAGGAVASVLGGPVGIAIAAATAGIAAMTAGVIGLVNALQTALGEFEKFKAVELQSRSMFGEGKGGQLAKALQQYSVPAIYDTQSLNKLGVGLGGSQAVGFDQALPTLKAIADALAGTGVTDNARFQQAARVFEQIAGGPKVRDEDLNQQLRESAPALLSILRQEAGKRGQVLGGKDSMATSDFFQMIRELGQTRFKGSQERLQNEIPSLKWANIMQSVMNRLIPIGEKVAKQVLPILDKFDKGIEKAFDSKTFASAQKLIEKVMSIGGKFVSDTMERLGAWFEKNDATISRYVDAWGRLWAAVLEINFELIAKEMELAAIVATKFVDALGEIAKKFEVVTDLVDFATGKSRREETPVTESDAAYNKRIRDRRDAEGSRLPPAPASHDAMGRPIDYKNGSTKAQRMAADAYRFGGILR